LQSVKPPLQLPIVHDPAMHAPVEFWGEHDRPHAPQLFGSVANPALAYSHPSPEIPLQSLKPEGQVVATHAPAVQISLAEHCFVQLPQCRGSV
jgi:hypothetical protein